MNRQALASFAFGVGIAFATPGFAQKPVTVGGAPMFANKTIVENAVNSKDHTTLVTAVKAAGLVDTLSGPGPFTVFAPTNRAFGKLPPGTVETLVQPAQKRTLTSVLTYHVVPGKVTSKEVIKLKEAKTVQGGMVSIDAHDGVKVNDAKVITSDVSASNGVIHIIDSVLLPKE